MAALPVLALVHSPLVGPTTWEPTAEYLRRRDIPVVVCSLAGVTDGDPPYYERLARTAADAVLGADDDRPVVLVGHSGAGALLPAIADAMGERVRGAVFVDALLPHPGRSWFDTAPPQLQQHLRALVRAGRLPPWNEWFPPEAIPGLLPDADLRERFVAELPRLPIAYFEEPAPTGPGRAAVSCAYVRLTEAYDRMADEAEAGGWWVHREQADHLAPLTRAGWTADLVTRAVDATAGE